MAESNFIDYVKIYCRSGKGGRGSTHMHRAKYLPKGGPATTGLYSTFAMIATSRLSTEEMAARINRQDDRVPMHTSKFPAALLYIMPRQAITSAM